MTWFRQLTGCDEASPHEVRQLLKVEGPRLASAANGKSWQCGTLLVPSLAELRQQVAELPTAAGDTTVHQVVANVQQLHLDVANRHALFQVASQFNLLEMVSPGVTPEAGVGRYEDDFTQGPACAIAAGAGTIYRNYFAKVDDQVGQTADRQIDCLADFGTTLGNTDQRLWQMRNGYALPTPEGLREVHDRLVAMDEPARDQLRQTLRIGLQCDTEVTLDDAGHTVTQAYCSAMPVAYTSHDDDLWEPLARLVLEAAYEATLAAARINHHRTGCNRVFLTLLGGGAFGNRQSWILDAARRSLEIHANSGLQVTIVSYGAPHAGVTHLLREVG